MASAQYRRFRTLLIANRGEIACRVIKTARRMGIATVAVYSDADARAPFVQMADEAVRLGPPPAAQSYLLADKIIEACKQSGAISAKLAGAGLGGTVIALTEDPENLEAKLRGKGYTKFMRPIDGPGVKFEAS